PKQLVEKLVVIAVLIRFRRVLLESREQVMAVTIKPAAVLQKVKEDQPLQEQLGFRVSCPRQQPHVALEVPLNGIHGPFEALEEVSGKRLLVERLRPALDPAVGIRAVVRPDQSWQIELIDSAVRRLGGPAKCCQFGNARFLWLGTEIREAEMLPPVRADEQ